jgi:hypothetical protein
MDEIYVLICVLIFAFTIFIAIKSYYFFKNENLNIESYTEYKKDEKEDIIERDKPEEVSIKANNNKLDFLRNVIILFWSYKEMRYMVAACVVIYFASTMFGSHFEISIVHSIKGNVKSDVELKHDFGGNLHNPINIQLSDPGYPVKLEVRNR